MNCRQVRHSAPLYHSGELSAADRDEFQVHLDACASCARDIEAEAALDRHIASALRADRPDSSRVEAAVRRRLPPMRAGRRWWYAAAACVIVAAVAATLLLRPAPVPRWYADAARDHRIEIREGQPRRWRTAPAEIESVASQAGLSRRRVADLAAPGYSLERAKFCGLDGQRMLHLVFTDGRRRYSLYLAPHAAPPASVRTLSAEAETVSAVETGRYRAAVVTEAAPADCEALVKAVFVAQASWPAH